MISKNIFKFLKGIAANNNKEWLDANRGLYEQSKQDFAGNVLHILTGMSARDKAFTGLQPKDCIFRLNRDVRFSKEKHPYKTHFAAYFNPAGKKGEGAGYYLHITPGGSFAAVGLWQPPAPHLALIRQEIDYNPDEWKKIIGQKKLLAAFNNGFSLSDTLQRPPRGYTDDNPVIEYLKMKNFVLSCNYSDKEIQTAGFEKQLLNSFEAAAPFIGFINQSLH